MPVIARLLGYSIIWTTSRDLLDSERVVERAHPSQRFDQSEFRLEPGGSAGCCGHVKM